MVYNPNAQIKIEDHFNGHHLDDHWGEILLRLISRWKRLFYLFFQQCSLRMLMMKMTRRRRRRIVVVLMIYQNNKWRIFKRDELFFLSFSVSFDVIVWLNLGHFWSPHIVTGFDNFERFDSFYPSVSLSLFPHFERCWKQYKEQSKQ